MSSQWVGADQAGVQRSSDEGFQRRVRVRVPGDVEAFIGQAPDAWGDPVAQEVSEGEHVVGKAGGVGVVLFDP